MHPDNSIQKVLDKITNGFRVMLKRHTLETNALIKLMEGFTFPNALDL
jgi:hypothetical protein